MLNPLEFEVMNATADDWESLNQILPDVCEHHRPTEPIVVAETIAKLIDLGLMEEMQNRIVEPAAVVADLIECWFRMTTQGRAIWKESCPHNP